ncbi:hypothetical protein BGZ96_000506 [Linnemannia gamsii]|uniref:DUF221-domain-containing protein n=1 Tax=Linnemannia gamsii TaxID=64522 RepID=A0ABQ7KBL6_9FUNG|nr:hypothetical protein BGZ96_000506 [Linnemannia gamsii]
MAIGTGIFIAFLFVRHWSNKIYQPRTYLVTKDIRSPPLPPGAFSWVTASFKVKDTELLEKVGLDAYMFLRFLRMSAMLFAGCTLLAIPILIPINLHGGGDQTGMMVMTIANVNDSWRLWFHLILTYIFCGSSIALLWREMREYTQRRHAYLMSVRHNKTPQSTTILVTAIPEGLNTEEALFDIFDRFPGGVSKIWLNRHPKDILKLCKERDEIVPKLEMAEYNYIRSAYSKKAQKDPHFKGPVRPLGRVSAIPFFGKKVDLINYYTERLAHLNNEIESAQQTGSLKSLNSAFIQFNAQFGAQSAVQTVVHPKPFHMAPMYSEISPLDVVWDNMNLSTVVTKGRRLIILAVSTAMILFWTIPTLFIASLSSLSVLVQAFSFLAFLENLPAAVIPLVEGIIPPLMLAGLMAILPVILTTMATYEGHVRLSAITHSLMSKYFLFLVVNVLLISTLTNGFIDTYHKLQESGFKLDDIVKLIAQSLPTSSSFFINYVLLRGFTGPALELIQIAPLLLNFFFTHTMAKSPRQIWDVQGRLESVNYGVLFPQQTLIFCIGIVFSTITPLILPFVTFYFTLFYFVYRHQFLYVYSQPIETGGLAFPKAVKQVFTGIFISEITLFGIFVLNQTVFNAVPLMVLMGILFACTALSLSNMNEAFDPLVTFLPVALFSKDLHVDRHGNVTDGDEKKKPKSKHHQQEQLQYQQDVERPSGDGTIMTLENLSSKNLTSNQVATAGNISSPLDHLQLQPQDSDERTRTDFYHATYTMDFDSSAPPSSHYNQQQPQHHATFDMSHLHPDQFLRPNISYDCREWGSKDGSHHMLPLDFQQSRRYQSEDDINRLSPRLSHVVRFPSHDLVNSRPASLHDRPVSYAARPTSFNHHNSNIHNHRSDRPASFHERRDTDDSNDGCHNRGPWPEVTEEDEELERLQDRAYCHPAIYNVQKPVWLPMDERGLMEAEIDKLQNRGIVVATDGAYLDGKTSKASVGGLIYAPGEEAQYRLERGE